MPTCFRQMLYCTPLVLLACSTVPAGLVAQSASPQPANRQVTVDLNQKRAIGGVSKLDRTQYFNTHNPPRWSGQTPQMQQKLERDWRTFPTRFMSEIFNKKAATKSIVATIAAMKNSMLMQPSGLRAVRRSSALTTA